MLHNKKYQPQVIVNVMKDKVQATLNEIRVALQQDGGDIDLVGVDEETGIVRVELQGACRGCPYSQLTLTGYVEKLLKERIPGVNQVVNVNLEAMRTS
jgi:Fe-S cluster biogenesis protein NfuA